MRTCALGDVSPHQPTCCVYLLCLTASEARTTRRIAMAQAGNSLKALPKAARKQRTAQGCGTPGGRALGGLAGVDLGRATPEQAPRATLHLQTELRRGPPVLTQEVSTLPGRTSSGKAGMASILSLV